MTKKYFPSFVIASSLLIFCNFQCADKFTCEPARVTKGNNINVLPAATKYYNVGDTITLNITMPYSMFNDLTNSVVPLRRYKAMHSYSIMELTGGSSYNTKFAGEKFDTVASKGHLVFSGQSYSMQTFSVEFANDSILTNSFVSEIKFIPQQTGRFVIQETGGDMNYFGLCEGIYYISLAQQWNVSSRNTEVAAEAGITGDLFCKYQNVNSGFYLKKSDHRLFYFVVQ